MFWLRFLIESCQVYTPKSMGLLRASLKAKFWGNSPEWDEAKDSFYYS